MNLKLSLLLTFASIVCFSACKEEENTPPEPTAFTYTAPDSLIFEQSGTLTYPVSVQSASSKDFIASFSSLVGPFNNNGITLTIPVNQSRSFDITFNQFGVAPGSYEQELTVAVPNENNAIKTQKVQMVYRPNCAYAFRNYTIGEITYQINGELLNKNIDCEYNALGQLVVNGLTPHEIVLNIDCGNASVEMVPLIHLGNLVTCTGTIVGTQIALQLYDDGVLNSVGRVKF